MNGKEKGEIDKGLKLIVKSSIIVLIAFIFSKILGYLYRIIIARYFGPEIYGLFSLSVVIVSLFVMISLIGFSEGVVRYISFYRGKKEINKIRYLYRFASSLIFLFSLFVFIILFFSSEYISIFFFNNESLVIYLKILSFAIPFWAFAIFFLSIMRAFEKIKEISVIDNIFQNTFKIIILVVLIFFGLNSGAIIFSFFLGIFVTFWASYFYCKIKLPQIFLKNNLSEKTKHNLSSEIISYSLPMLFFNVMLNIFYWVDSFAIGFFKSATEVGLYNVVIPIVLLFNIAPEIFLQLFFPLATKEYSLKKFKFIKEISKQIGKWIFMINLPAFVIMIFFPEIIIKILVGSSYIVASNYLRLLSVGALFSSVFIISNNLISMVGKSKIIFFDIMIITFLNMILNIWFIQKPVIFGIDNSLGINGAAVATTISLIFFNILFLIQAKKYTGIVPIKKGIFNVITAAVFSAILLFFLLKIPFNNIATSIFLIITFLLIYVILLFIFKAFDKEDLIIFQTFKRKIKNDAPDKKYYLLKNSN